MGLYFSNPGKGVYSRGLFEEVKFEHIWLHFNIHFKIHFKALHLKIYDFAFSVRKIMPICEVCV
jgi:hypothetical protein